MIIKNKNFSREHLADFAPQPGDIIESCNLAQMHPHTAITTVAGLTFRDCNLTNCDLPTDVVREYGNHCHISYCGWLHDDYTCAVGCEHVVSSEGIIVDGVIVDTLYEYSDRVVI